ncbi:MAG: hypothetical protein LR017_01540 [Candidatus Pacebacteria bacterium]|nr:hypothetical protein [Candidatus Paceibacterota bacterium]
MYIECIGASGAGKTTIVAHTAQVLSAAGRVCVTRKTFFAPQRRKYFKAWWTVVHLWRLEVGTLRLLLQWARAKGVKNACMKIHEYIKIRQLTATMDTDTVALWDSGFVQLFSKLAVMGFVSEEDAFFLIQKHIPAQGVIVFLNTSLAESRNRKRKRAIAWESAAALARLEQEKDDPARMEFIQAVQAMQERMVQKLTAAHVSVLLLDGMQTPETNAALLVTHVQHTHYV